MTPEGSETQPVEEEDFLIQAPFTLFFSLVTVWFLTHHRSLWADGWPRPHKQGGRLHTPFPRYCEGGEVDKMYRKHSSCCEFSPPSLAFSGPDWQELLSSSHSTLIPSPSEHTTAAPMIGVPGNRDRALQEEKRGHIGPKGLCCSALAVFDLVSSSGESHEVGGIICP